MASSFFLISSLDLDISYFGNWSTVNASQLAPLGSLGPPLGSILPGLNATNGSLSYFFKGTSINAFGTVVVDSSTGQSPDWTCFLDGDSFGPIAHPNASENNWPLCQHAIPDGYHNLTISINSKTSTYLDYILYTPSSNIPSENTTIYVDSNDSAVVYDSTWFSALNGNGTSSPGGEVTISFTGYSLDYYGFVPSNLPHSPSSGQYSVDGQPSVSFSLNGSAPNSQMNFFNQKFFSTGTLKQGLHNLTVRNNGDSNVTPLTFDFALVSYDKTTTSDDPPRPAPSVGQNRPDQSSPPPLESLAQPHKNHMPTIIGSAIGGVVAIAAIVALVVLCRVRRKRRRRLHLEEAEDEIQRASIISPLSVSHIPQRTLPSSLPIAPAVHSVPGGVLPQLELISSRPNFSIPTVSMSIIPSQQRPPPTPSTSSSSKTNVTRITTVTSPNSTLLSHTEESNAGSSTTNVQDLSSSANEVTPMLPEEDREPEYETPPPTYTARANLVSPEKLRRYFLRRDG